MFGNPETTPGGRALRFYSSIRLEVRRAETMKREGDAVGNNVKIKVVKNKVAPPFKTAEVDMMFGHGISREGCILDMAEELDFVNKSGAWYSYKGEKVGQGRDKAKEHLIANPQLAMELENLVREKHGLATRPVPVIAADKDAAPAEEGKKLAKAGV